MNCPVCNLELVLSERQGIEIDYCPKCRGVWLDRGEMDKIIERSASPAPQDYAPEQRSGHYQPPPPPYHSERQVHNNHYGHKSHHKRKSFLEEIFDFD